MLALQPPFQLLDLCVYSVAAQMVRPVLKTGPMRSMRIRSFCPYKRNTCIHINILKLSREVGRLWGGTDGSVESICGGFAKAGVICARGNIALSFTCFFVNT
jgi:hypothetical protein